MARIDITVRGAGIFGLSVAWACVMRGASVRVVDPFGAMTDAAVLATTRQATFSVLFSRYLHLFSLPQSVDSLGVHVPVSLNQ